MIVHFTTVHPRDDSRIRSKQVATLAKAFGSDAVALYVQDGLGDEIDSEDGYRVVDTGPRLPRLSRMTSGAWRMIVAVARARPAVAHFHDPELLPWAILLRLRGIKVIYDVHEDMPQQVQHNPALPKLARRMLPPFVAIAEWIGGRLVNGVVGVTTTITRRFPPAKTVLVRNFPILAELHQPQPTPQRERMPVVTYVGYISEVRNVFGMMKAVARVSDPDVRLRLAGSFAIPETEASARSMPEWKRVIFDGWASRREVGQIMGEARAGLVVLLPVAHEMLTLPIKLFEYMAAGLPIIASDFPLWREIVAGESCGMLVDPSDPDAIARAIEWIISHPEEAEQMGQRGRRAVEVKYNWDVEATRLLTLYTERLALPINETACR